MGEQRRWGLLPMGELHPDNQCRYCKNPTAIQRVVFKDTQAVGFRCIDSVSCLRRRQRSKL
jgi:hypothetical protein